MQVTLYRVSSGYRNVCDGISVREPDSDTIYTEVVCELPDGYTMDPERSTVGCHLHGYR